jgi:hypothetical protein
MEVEGSAAACWDGLKVFNHSCSGSPAPCAPRRCMTRWTRLLLPLPPLQRQQQQPLPPPESQMGRDPSRRCPGPAPRIRAIRIPYCFCTSLSVPSGVHTHLLPSPALSLS